MFSAHRVRLFHLKLRSLIVWGMKLLQKLGVLHVKLWYPLLDAGSQ